LDKTAPGGTIRAGIKSDLDMISSGKIDWPKLVAQLAHVRQMYEPYLNTLSDRLLMPLPSWTLAEPMESTLQDSLASRLPEMEEDKDLIV
jgi:hypothetical protein